MTDKELLELAAKAAGYMRIEYTFWDPLTDDGDALRLAVKLQTPILVSNEIARCVFGSGIRASCTEPVGNDPYAATRRAIVRAAAEIGREMK